MDIMKRIDKAIADFEAWQGTRPSYLYLGREEAKELNQMVETAAEMISSGKKFIIESEKNRSKYSGLAIYLVNEDKHLKVS